MSRNWIDAHHHLWRYKPEDYPWMSDSLSALRRDYLLPHLEAVTTSTGVTGTIAVQARQSMEETEWLSEIASGTDLIRAVVGWAPLIDPDAASHLERFAGLSKVKGMRHVLHDEADPNYMLRDDFNRGVSLLKGYNLRYDILIFEQHLPQTIEFVDRHPNQVFIVDHIAKPKIRERLLTPWRENISELARRSNVYCKLSGMVTEADWTSWQDEDLAPYIEVVLEAFGPRRLMFGSDWPVCTLAASYQRWADTVTKAIERFSADEQASILAGSAIEAYTLDRNRESS
jgi:L-fuconolactonase